MPTENRSASTTRPYSYRSTNWHTGYIAAQSSGTNVYQSWTKYRSGNWDRKRPDPLTPSPYDLVHYRRYQPHGRLSDLGPTYLRVWEGQLSYTVPNSWTTSQVLPSYKDTLRNEALIDALINLKDQKFNTGVALAEASGVATMAADFMRSVTKIRRDFINGDLRKAYSRFRRKYGFISWSAFKRQYGASLGRAELLSKLPNTWLYYHFGVKPTLADIHAAHEDWFRRHAVPGRNTLDGTVRGSAKYRSERRGDGGGAYPHAVDLHQLDRQSMRVYLTVRPKNEFIARLAQQGVTNFPEAVWNGIPFSWAVDYFTSMGDWLSVLDAGMGYEFGKTVESYLRRTSHRCDRWDMAAVGVASVSLSPYVDVRTTLERRVVTELYPPMYRVLPKMKLKGPSVKQFANLLSVFASVFGRGPPRVRI